LNSEDRKARARVDLVHISLTPERRWNHTPDAKIDPFGLWFEDNFKSTSPVHFPEEEAAERRAGLVKGAAYIPNMVKLYNQQMSDLMGNFEQINKIPADLLKSVGVERPHVIAALKQKITGLKNLYWKEVFSNLDTIRERLTSKTIDDFQDRMMQNVTVDFTADNIYAVVQWVIANANQYFDAQLLEVYENLTAPKNVKNYKSNKVLVNGKSRWQMRQDNHSHYALEYRLVHEMHQDSEYSYGRVNGLHRNAATFLSDMITIGETLGFAIDNRVEDFEWQPGIEHNFEMSNGKTFMKARSFKNGNIHLKMNRDFMKAFNLQAGRLLGWLQNPEHAAKETGYSAATCKKYLTPTLMQIAPRQLPMLTAA